MKKDSLQQAKNTFKLEAETILKTGENINWDDFSNAVELLKNAERIATSGCGHSGIACKHFAHLLCCIEKPSRFLSPAEAVHGATGFLQQNDLLVVASRGGKTDELMPIIDIAKAKNAKVLSITENLSSPMAEKSDIALPMVVERECDKHNMQSTSSFAALSSVFDALQVALLNEIDYDPKKFAIVHPGGAVGKRLNTK